MGAGYSLFLIGFFIAAGVGSWLLGEDNWFTKGFFAYLLIIAVIGLFSVV